MKKHLFPLLLLIIAALVYLFLSLSLALDLMLNVFRGSTHLSCASVFTTHSKYIIMHGIAILYDAININMRHPLDVCFAPLAHTFYE